MDDLDDGTSPLPTNKTSLDGFEEKRHLVKWIIPPMKLASLLVAVGVLVVVLVVLVVVVVVVLVVVMMVVVVVSSDLDRSNEAGFTTFDPSRLRHLQLHGRVCDTMHNAEGECRGSAVSCCTPVPTLRNPVVSTFLSKGPLNYSGVHEGTGRLVCPRETPKQREE
ncbi:hypothetical protein C0Q70_15822 [Pomacea canaliculata]|uniref:Uncharacterized protein n=1 Tax=Pomacea canaliculata TaxID=400727 RepID=A0A2T7NVY8_POMCA|nr:hypothetical protein C0Q70_15822 [Pomacea canaliculata]